MNKEINNQDNFIPSCNTYETRKRWYKKIFNSVFSRFLFFAMGLFISIAILTVYAAWDDTVVPGDMLTADKWNALVNNAIQDIIPNQGLVRDVNNKFGIIDCDANQILQRNAADTAWECIVNDIATGWNHIATKNIQMNNYWLSGDGGDEGVFVNANGNVGIGTTNPKTTLHIKKDSDGDAVRIASPSGSYRDISWYEPSAEVGRIRYFNSASGSGNDFLRFKVGEQNDVLTLSPAGDLWMNGTLTVAGAGNTIIAGNVGIGTTGPGGRLVVKGAGTTTGIGLQTQNSSGAALVTMLDNGNVGIAGDVGIGGNLTVVKIFSAGADVAEEFATLENIEEGTVVIMGDNGYKSAKPCDSDYDIKVIGVVSDNAAVIMGKVESEHKAIIAITGVVAVKAVSKNGIIKRGDLLTTSNISGHAMKAADAKIGTVIGKALEDCDKEKCEIKALINLQ